MEVHKPKPWHGWREFLKEYLIIVVGVLTALAAEAVVENLHERRLSAEAREAIRDELRLDIDMLRRRQSLEPCLRARIGEIAALLDRAEAGEPFTPAQNVAGPLFMELHVERWQTATAGGRTSLLSSAEQRAFGRLYQPVTAINNAQQNEFLAWSHLGALNGQKRLSPEMIYGARIALSEARDVDRLMGGGFQVAESAADRLELKGKIGAPLAPGATDPAVPAICHPLDTAASTSF